MPTPPAVDRAPSDQARVRRLTSLLDEHDDAQRQLDQHAQREQDIRDALRDWGRSAFGTVDAFCIEVASRAGVSVAHARNALTYPKSQAVFDEAIALFRERTSQPAPSV